MDLLKEYMGAYYECNMNGSNHLEETDAAPIHLCPVCLRKIQHAIEFDPRTRYAKLSEFYKANGLKEEREWVEKRRKWIAGE